MITSFRVRNFKNLVDTGVDFHPQRVNVIIGPNGCGKSSLLQALDFMRAFFMSSVEVYLQGKGWNYRDLPNLRQTSKSIEWDIKAELDPDEEGACGGTYSYSVKLAPRRYLSIGREELRYRPVGAERGWVLLGRKGRGVRLMNAKTGEHDVSSYPSLPASIISTFNSPADKQKYPELIHFRRWVERFRYFLIWDPKILRSPDRGKHVELGPSGEHLAPLLAVLRQNEGDRFAKLLKTIRRLFPHVSDITVTGGRTWGWRSIQLHEKDVAFNSQQMSDGVLRLLAIASLLYVDQPPSVVMLEEPEDGIHPQLVREAVQILRQLSLRKVLSGCQVFFTTHSPYVLDEFYDTPEEVFVMDRKLPKAGATIRQLSAASQLPSVRQAMEDKSLGEVWYTGLIGGTAGVGGI